MFSIPAAIKEEIERVFGQPLKYPADCQRLALSVRDTLNETIGVTTLKRLFGFVSDVIEPRRSTLDILAKYCGFDDYEEMKKAVSGAGDSDFEKEPDIKASSLLKDSIVGFQYLPDRKVKLRYLGESEFEVLLSENSSLKEGDVITVSSFLENSPLIVSKVMRDSSDLGRYTAGKASGIFSLYLKEPDSDASYS